ncbi:MAG TPA: hypothetical protein VJN89_12715 [Candidatus Acidoferrum sp.]|nr:hypothetical protein [Candidatus Acidoferrum sp.]
MLAFYRGLMRLYPPAYRSEFGDEMMDVLLEVRAENRAKDRLALFFSGARETGGLLFGAVREQFRRITGSYDNGIFSARRFAMKSEFRFPKATVALMVVILAAVIFTIEKAKAISMSIAHPNPQVGPIHSTQDMIVHALLATLIWAIGAGAIGWGILYALRRTGVQQLSEMNPAAHQRSSK